MSLEDVIGVPIKEQISSILNLNKSPRELEVITQVNAGTLNNIIKNKDDEKNNSITRMNVENAEKFSMAYSRLVSDGVIGNLNNSNGLRISEKVKYILRSKIDSNELAKILKITRQTVNFHRESSNICGIQLRKALSYEKLFNDLCRNKKINLITERQCMVVQKKSTDYSGIFQKVYESLRMYRYGRYLVFDEYDFYKNHVLKEKIENHLKNKDIDFKIIKEDLEIDNDYDLKFIFNVLIDYGDKCNYKIYLRLVKTPKKLTD